MNGKMIELIRRNGILLAGAGIACAALFFWVPGEDDEAASIQNEIWKEESEEKTSEKADSLTEQESAVINSFKVDVKGAVHKPGVYEFAVGDRVTDVIQKAGGLKEGADSKQVNMAQLVEDEMVVYIPKEGEQIDDTKQIVAEKSGNTEEGHSNGIININKASSEELQELPGIGPSKATAIIQKREELSSFKTIEDLKEVSGIGDKTFEKLKDLITVN